jgi:PAS domain S-box-containing protein
MDSQTEFQETTDIEVLLVRLGEDEVIEPLETAGFGVTIRSGSDDVPEAVATADPDCVVVDHDPPVLDARTVLERIRDAGHDQPLLLYSPEVDDAVVERVLADGGAYLCEHSDTADRSLLLARVQSLAESYRREKRIRLRDRAVDQAPIGITIADVDAPDEELVYVNDRFETVTGYDADFAVGRNCRFLQGPGTDPAIVDGIREAIDARETVSEVVLNYDADGTPFWNQLDIAPVRDESGDITHFFGFQKDVTERQELKRDLRRQQELQERFTEIVSHDLRNPIGLAQGHLALMQEEYDDESLDQIDHALERMLTLIDDVLELARGGTAVVDPSPVDLSAAAAAARATVRDQRVDVRIGDDLPHPEGDVGRLTTLFENLFRNAAEHATDDGEPATVRVGRSERGFYVEDDGAGIPEDERESVFEWGVTFAEDGTGFGLAIVGVIAEVHGWAVTVGEGSDGGARFEFEFDGTPTV